MLTRPKILRLGEQSSEPHGHKAYASLQMGRPEVEKGDPRDCVVERGALFPSTPRVAFGGDKVASRVLTKVIQAVVCHTQVVAEWERVSSSFTGWGTIKIANLDYFVVGVLQNPGCNNIPYLFLLCRISGRELVQIDFNKFATSFCRSPFRLLSVGDNSPVAIAVPGVVFRRWWMESGESPRR